MKGARVDTVVDVENLTVSFEREGHVVKAVNGITFSLDRGEVLTVIGESGSGKSVMLRTLLGLNPPYARIGGRVSVKGVDMAKLAPDARSAMRGRDISMIFQEPATAFDPVYTIGEQIAETIVRHEGTSHQAAMQRARDLLDLVAIPSAERRLRNFPHEMSGGMRQRAMIALALACNPAVLLADEPTTALDATVQIQLLVLLRKLQRERNMALIFVTHDMGVAAEISDRVAVMYAGRLVEHGTAEDVLLQPAHPYTSGLLDSTVHAGMRGKTLRTISGSPPDLRNLPKGCSFGPRCARFVPECMTENPVSRMVSASHGAACLRMEESAVV
jgi:peptide/nickel transport system ATP-binding protein